MKNEVYQAMKYAIMVQLYVCLHYFIVSYKTQHRWILKKWITFIPIKSFVI